jgi:hypothetical protein
VQFGGGAAVGIGAAVVVARGGGAGVCAWLGLGGIATVDVGSVDDGSAEFVVCDGKSVGTGASVDEAAPLSVVVSEEVGVPGSDGEVKVTEAAVGSDCGVLGCLPPAG